MAHRLTDTETGSFESDPLWYKDAIIYELHVRAFQDSNGDGHGDFSGLTQKLDYLQGLGVTAIWLLPFYPSPLRDDGYDIAQYTDVHPNYGNLQDFRLFLREAHRRGLRVITELVLNHTSDQHAWFQRARRAKAGSSYRNFYVWSDTPDRYPDTRVIFRDFEPSNWSWDPVARSYYWHRFYAHQPDLNFDNPQVRRALTRVVDFWLRLGVDGLRLDAVPYLYEREDTSNENLPETHQYLKQLRAHVDARFRNRMLLAEANQWPEEAAAYFGAGDECHMAFHFPLMPRLFMSIRQEDRFPIIDILQQTPSIPDTSQWALFLRNHDELTLEMVTDEDRDYMYRSYARDPQARINLGIRHRLAPLLGNDRRRIELMNGLLLSLPGTPVVYYGDEIGMGDNIFLGDRNGVRTPMQWNADRNAGFSRTNPHRLYLPAVIDPEYHYEAVNVETQQNNSQSLLWWMKRLIALRKRHKAFGHGRLEFLSPENRKVLAFLRTHEKETILVVANLSRNVQYVELDLSRFQGALPVELSGKTTFPPVGEVPYMLTLGAYGFLWFALDRPEVYSPLLPGLADVGPPVVSVRGTWEHVFQGRALTVLQRLLPAYLASQSWFMGTNRPIADVEIIEAAPVDVGDNGSTVYLTLVKVEYSEGDADVYLVPLAFAGPDQWEVLQERMSHPFIARVRVLEPQPGQEAGGLLYDALGERAFSVSLFNAIRRRRRFKGLAGEAFGTPSRGLREMQPDEIIPEPSRLRIEQDNTSVLYGDRYVLRVYRRVETGANPELETVRFLTAAGFEQMPALAGTLEYRPGRSEPATLALLRRFVPNEGNAWLYTLDVLDRYYDRVLAEGVQGPEPQVRLPAGALLDGPPLPLAQLVREELGGYLPFLELLARRTAELHLTLASKPLDPLFAPETFPRDHQRSLFQASRTLLRRNLDLLRRRMDELPEDVRAKAGLLLEAEDAITRGLGRILDGRLFAQRIRVHGDYRLDQILFTGKDFVFVDFEGKPARPMTERRLKRSPLVDVAGMLRSFHYATAWGLRGDHMRVEDLPELTVWARAWQYATSDAFLRAYLEALGDSPLVPAAEADRRRLLTLLLADKAAYELGYELNNRVEWVGVPVEGLLQIADIYREEESS